jgi:cytochrome c oxidase cbb3-type subunit 3
VKDASKPGSRHALRKRGAPVWLLALGCALALGGCAQREQRRTDAQQPASAQATQQVQVSQLKPNLARAAPAMANVYEQRAWDVAEGQRLFVAFNCVGCHAHGGGAIGPPLKDAYWIYGGDPENIYTSIVEGRPNGMPSFRGRIADFEIWRIVAYVRSMSGHVRKDIAPGRSDNMSAKKPEASTKKQPQLGTTGRPLPE